MNNLNIKKFPDGFNILPDNSDGEYLLISRKGDKKPFKISVEKLAAILGVAAGDIQRIKAEPAGPLPTPDSPNKYMVVTDVGTWTYGGVEVGSNADGYQTTFWFTGDTWVNNGSVRVKGESETIDHNITPLYASITNSQRLNATTGLKESASTAFRLLVYFFNKETRVSLTGVFSSCSAYSLFSDEELTTLITKGDTITGSNVSFAKEFTVPANSYLAISELTANPITLKTIELLKDYTVNNFNIRDQENSGMLQVNPEFIVRGYTTHRTTGVMRTDVNSISYVFKVNVGDKFHVYSNTLASSVYSVFSDIELTTLVEFKAGASAENIIDEEITITKAGYLVIPRYSLGKNIPTIVTKYLTGKDYVARYNEIQKETTDYDLSLFLKNRNVSVFEKYFEPGQLNKEAGTTTIRYSENNIVTTEPIPVELLTGIAVNNDHHFIASFLAGDKSTVLGYSSNWLTTSGDINPLTKYVQVVIKRRDNTKVTSFADTGLQLSVKPMSDLNVFGLLKNASVVSDYKTELLAHGSYPAVDTDYIWVVYYCSTVQRTESASSGKLFVRLAKVSPCDLSNPLEFIDILKTGDNVDGFLSGTISPYDPVIIVKDDVVRIIMVADNQNDAIGVRMVIRDYDKANKTLSNITLAMLKYTHDNVEYNVELSNNNLKVMVDRVLGRTDTNVGFYPILSKIIKHEGVYYSYLASLAIDLKAFQGCLIKSTDGVNWELVSFPTALNGYREVWEAGIEVVDNEIFVLIKHTDGYTLIKYNLTSSTWSTYKNLISQTSYTGQGSRPSLFYFKGKLYALVNTAPTYNSVFRSKVEISEINPSTLTTVKRRSFIAENGCHYFDIANYFGEPYFFYTEDRKRYNLTSGNSKGNISACHMWFLEKFY